MTRGLSRLCPLLRNAAISHTHHNLSANKAFQNTSIDSDLSRIPARLHMAPVFKSAFVVLMQILSRKTSFLEHVTVWLSIKLTVFLICPLLIPWWKLLSWRLYHESSSRCGNVLTNSLMILSASPVIFGVAFFLLPEGCEGGCCLPSRRSC